MKDVIDYVVAFYPVSVSLSRYKGSKYNIVRLNVKNNVVVTGTPSFRLSMKVVGTCF